MRLRQAHAILETVTALEAAALGIDMAPLDYDEPGHTRPSDGDQMEGGCELTDPDSPGRDALYYNISLKASRDGQHIEASTPTRSAAGKRGRTANDPPPHARRRPQHR